MRHLTTHPGDDASAGQRPVASRASAFEAAQEDQFEAVGLAARSRFVDLPTPQVRTHVFEAGPSREATPLLLVHGGGAFGAFLSPLMAELQDARVVAFDRPGYGLSGRFVYTKRNLRRTAVDVLDGVLDALEVDRVDLLGHSMGGFASVVYALARPERVRRLILVGACAGFPGASPPVPLRLLTVPVLGRLIQGLTRPGEAGVLDVASVFGEREAIQRYPALVRAMAAEMADPKSAAAGTSELAAFFSVRGWHPSVELREAALRSLRQPTLVVWGEHDPIGTPDDVRAGVEAIPDVRFETMPAAHGPFLAYPERCARLVDEFRADHAAD